MQNLYDFSAKSLMGGEVSLSDYLGQVVLVVNTASKCGLTGQYAGLQKLYETYNEQGFSVIGFPCDQFANQEPGDSAQISDFCALNYGVTFPMMAKIDVNGANTHPLFTWLKTTAPGTFGNQIKWNFTKFLIGRDGQPVRRFAPKTKPERLSKAIEDALAS